VERTYVVNPKTGKKEEVDYTKDKCIWYDFVCGPWPYARQADRRLKIWEKLNAKIVHVKTPEKFLEMREEKDSENSNRHG
jgi:hypothetical protein